MFILQLVEPALLLVGFEKQPGPGQDVIDHHSHPYEERYDDIDLVLVQVGEVAEGAKAEPIQNASWEEVVGQEALVAEKQRKEFG